MRANQQPGKSIPPDLSPFGNWITGTILFITIALILVGLALVLKMPSTTGRGVGLAFVVTGTLSWILGNKSFATKPLTGGALYFWDIPVMTWFGFGDEQVVVGGRTIIWTIFPFCFSVQEFLLTHANKIVPIRVKSSNGPILEGTANLTVRVNEHDVYDFFLAGGDLETVLKQQSDMLENRARPLAAQRTDQELVSDGGIIGREMAKDIQQGSVGLLVVTLVILLHQSKAVEEAMEADALEEYQRISSAKDNETLRIEAQKQFDFFKGQVSMKECFDLVFQAELKRQGNVKQVKTTGGKSHTLVTP